MSDDFEARHRRAARLRQQIAELTGKRDSGADIEDNSKHDVTEQTGRRSPPRIREVSPRSFIERRMRELSEDQNKE